MSGAGNDLGMFQHPRFGRKEEPDDLERLVLPCEVDPNAPQPFEPKLAAATAAQIAQVPSATDDEQDLRTALSNNPTMIMELDMDGNVRYLLSNWNKIVGTKSKKIVGKPIANIIVANTPEDLTVFQDAISKMIADDCSYKVKFVTATGDGDANDESTTSSQHGEGEGDDGDDTEIASVSQQLAMKLPSPPPLPSPQPPLPSMLLILLKLLNDGDIIELEAQGILMRTGKDDYLMWTVKPVVLYNVDLAIPQPLIDILGAGLELFEGYLVQLRELGVANEETIPPPKTVLCRICENEIPAWFIERHLDLCVVEHRADDDIQEAHDALCEQRHLILAITDLLAHGLLLLPLPLALLELIASALLLLLLTLSFELIQEYKGIPLPTVLRTPGTVQTLLPLRPLTHQRLRSQLIGLKKFPFGLLARLVDICEEAIQINPPLAATDGEISLSPPSEHHMMAVAQATPMELLDPAMVAMIADTTAMVAEKVAAVERMVRALRYLERIKCQVDDLVLETVSDTLSQIRHQSLALEGELSRKVSHRESDPLALRLRQGSQKTLKGLRQGLVLLRSLSVLRLDSAGKVPTVAHQAGNVTPLSPALSLPLSRPPLDRELRGRQDPLPTLGLAYSRVYELPLPTQTGPMISTPIAPTPKVASAPLNFDHHHEPTTTPQSKLLLEFEYAKLVTPNDILQRLRPLLRPPLRPLLERLLDANLVPPLNLLLFLLPRRRMSPIPYGDKTNLLLLQRLGPGAPGLMIGGSVATPLGSPHIGASRGDLLDLTLNIPPLPPAATKRTLLLGLGLLLAVASTLLSKGQAKPPLSPLLVTSAPKAAPSTGGIRDYTVVKPISKGAFGLVFLAKRKRVGEYVAIKCLKKTDMIAKNQIVNVKLERAVLMKQANLPYVTQLYLTFQLKEWLYLVMEYLPGGDLASLVKNLGTIGDWACNFIAQIVVCVDDLHRRDIIHRDLKPDNILIDAQGHLKLTDFGLSRMGVVGRQPGRGRPRTQDHLPRPSSSSISWLPVVDARNAPSLPTLLYVDQFAQQLPPLRLKIKGDGRADLKDTPALMRTLLEALLSLVEDEFPVTTNPPTLITLFTLYDPQKDHQMSRFVGTPDYFAPETIKGEGQLEALDWWLIGCILFEFLFGTPPFHASTPDHVFANILAGDIDWPPLSPEDMDHYCPPEARDLITKLLVEDPEQRLGSGLAEEIKLHPYFKDINWDTLFETPGPFVPPVDDPELTDYFDPRGAEMMQFPMDGLDSQEPELFEPLNQLGALAFHQGRARRGLRLADSLEFGLFYFRNLAVLEKANKDAINRLKNEHMEHRLLFLLTGLLVVLAGELPLTSHGSRQRELSFGQLVSASPGANCLPFKRPISPVPPPPMFDELKSDPTTPAGTGPPQIPPQGFLTTLPAPSPPTYKHERMELILSNYSLGDDLLFDKDMVMGVHRHLSHPFNLLRDLPVTLDLEETKLLALLRVHKRRQLYRRAALSRQGLFSADTAEPVGLGLGSWHSQFDVLYCEPLALVRAATTRVLERHGCLVVGVGDGDELVRRATGQVKFDLIMTCMKLTKVGAIEAAKLIKYTTGVNTTTPIVAVTAYGDIARELGVFDDVLDKPIDDGKVARCLARLVSADDAIESD